MRLNYRAYPQAIAPLRELQDYVRQSGLEQPLIELIFMRVSQLNGCAFCLDMHSKDARAAGETEQRLFLLHAWRETPFYSERERAALSWAEAVTRLGEQGVPDDVYAAALASFGEKGLIDLNMTVVLMNAWNRIAIPYRVAPGGYKPGHHLMRRQACRRGSNWRKKNRGASRGFFVKRWRNQAALTRLTMASPKLSVLPLPPRSGVTASRSLVRVSRIAVRILLPLSAMPR